MSLQSLVTAGAPATSTFGAPGSHGAGNAGTHGIGVSTPSAAAVADATSGFARLLHIPNVGTLAIGALSSTPASGNRTCACALGNTVSGGGATPNEHCSIAVPLTRNDTARLRCRPRPRRATPAATSSPPLAHPPP